MRGKIGPTQCKASSAVLTRSRTLMMVGTGPMKPSCSPLPPAPAPPRPAGAHNRCNGPPGAPLSCHRWPGQDTEQVRCTATSPAAIPCNVSSAGTRNSPICQEGERTPEWHTAGQGVKLGSHSVITRIGQFLLKFVGWWVETVLAGGVVGRSAGWTGGVVGRSADWR